MKPYSPSDLPRVVVILPRGEAVRNIVYSEALRLLTARSEVWLLSVQPNSDVWNLMKNFCQHIDPLVTPKDRRVVRVMRDILDSAHGRWLWSEAAKERWRLRDIEARKPLPRFKRSAKKLVSRPFANQHGLTFLSALESWSSRVLRTSDHYLNLFCAIRPDLVFNASQVHGTSAVQAVRAARWLGIRTAAFVFSWDNLTSQGRIIPEYDSYLVWNDSLKRQLMAIYPGVTPQQVEVTGTPQFDFHFDEEFHLDRATFCHKIGADPGRPLVLYTTGMANHMPGEPHIVEQIANMLRRMDDLARPQLLVRVYPKDQTGRFEELRRRRPDILFPPVAWVPNHLTPEPQDCVDLTNTLRHAAVGINVASTVSLELCMFDKPVINIAYNPPQADKESIDFARYYDFDHYLPVIDSGAVALARSPGQLEALIRDALLHPSELSEQRRSLLRSMFGETLDGRCGERVATVLLRLATEARERKRD